jgi:hypothetical protein
LRIDGSHEVTIVPRDVTVCPECGENVEVDVTGWDVVTGLPEETCVLVSCCDDEEEHEYELGLWYNSRKAVMEWLEARNDL